MGLLKVSNQANKHYSQEELRAELDKARRELDRSRRHNDSLVSQVNNLLHYINEQSQHRQSLQKRTIINPKTGLPNHNQMDQDLHQFFTEYMEQGEQTAGSIVLIKLGNNFDIICKTLKPPVIEWIVYQTSIRIKEFYCCDAPIYHTRDDEFILILKGQTQPKALRHLLNNLYKEIAKPHIFSGYHINIDCNIGVAFFPENGVSKSSLLNSADIALTYAKKQNQPITFFSDHMRNEVVEKMEMQNYIIKALEEQSIKEIDKQFFIHTQPIVTVNEIKNGVPVIERMDAEALIRWNHPEKNIISPDTFIPVAEETGLIIILGKWVLYTATEQIEIWQNLDLDTHLSINVSPRQFKNNDLINSIRRIIKFRGINPEKLGIEITENSLLDDPEESIRKIQILKDIGISIAIDDFGTGFSSVNYLRRLPVDVVKIDQSFIHNIVNSRQDRSLIKAIIAMTAELGMNHVVEGVETLEQLNVLLKLGINRFQGYLFSRPLSPENYAKFYRETFSQSPLSQS